MALMEAGRALMESDTSLAPQGAGSSDNPGKVNLVEAGAQSYVDSNVK